MNALNSVLGLITDGQRMQKPLFPLGSVWDCLSEARFTMLPDADPYQQLFNYFRQRIINDQGTLGAREYLEKCSAELGQGDGRFTSAARIVFFSLAYVGDLVIRIPVEVQLRTAVQDIWSEIDHKLKMRQNQTDDQHVEEQSRALRANLSYNLQAANLRAALRDVQSVSRASPDLVEYQTTSEADQPIEDFQLDELTNEDWEEIKSQALDLIEASSLDSPGSHLAYVREKIMAAVPIDV